MVRSLYYYDYRYSRVLCIDTLRLTVALLKNVNEEKDTNKQTR